MSETWLTRHPWCTRQSWRSPTGQSFWPAGRMTEPARVVVGHSTETVGFPGYRNGADAPHFTIDLPSGLVRQHIPLEWGSRCLAVSTGGVTDRTVNITGTIQIEVIGAVTPGYPRTFGHYDLPGRFPTDVLAQQHMARLIAAIYEATGKRIPLQLANVEWVAYPASYGVRARQRLSSAAFRAARGWLGHQHAPANSHGDGVLGRAVAGKAPDMERVLAIARGSAAPQPIDVTAPAGSTWEVTTAALNCRSGPGTEHQVIGTAERGIVITATGRTSGPWIEAQTPYQLDHGIKAWWHSGFLARTTTVAPPKPDATIKAAQVLLVALGYDVGDDGPDGFHGPDTTVAIAAYTAAYRYTGGPTDHRALLTHLEDTMTDITAELVALRQLVIDRTTVELRPATAELTGNAPGRRIPLEQALDLTLRLAGQSTVHARGAETHSRAAEAHTAGLEAALAELGQAVGLTPEEIKQIVDDRTAERADELLSDLQVVRTAIVTEEN